MIQTNWQSDKQVKKVMLCQIQILGEAMEWTECKEKNTQKIVHESETLGK